MTYLVINYRQVMVRYSRISHMHLNPGLLQFLNQILILNRGCFRILLKVLFCKLLPIFCGLFVHLYHRNVPVPHFLYGGRKVFIKWRQGLRTFVFTPGGNYVAL
jgi:hypothetical protein